MAEKELGMTSPRFILDTLPSGVLVYRESGDLLFLNATGAAILEVENGALEGQNVAQLFGSLPHVDMQTSSLSKMSDVHRSDVFLEPLLYEFGVGDKKRFLRCRVRSVPWQGAEPNGLVFSVIFRDVTEDVASRRKRERYLQMSSMFQLLPTLAHEIKNPLAGIQSMVEVLQEEVTSEQHIEELDVILDELERIRFLVDRMRLIDQTFWHAKTETELTKPLQRTFRPLSVRAQHLGVRLLCQLPGSIHARLHPDMIRMIVLNLVNNALDACSRGDQVVVSLEVIEDDVQEQLHIVVSDTGKGMKSEVLQHALEPFYSTKSMGSGIGLALVREVVEQFGGELELWSQVDEGTRMTVILPINNNKVA